MAPGWTSLEDNALLLALVQSMAPDGPSKHQFEAALKRFGENPKWTIGAVSQHFNKALRNTSPATFLGEVSESSTPAKAKKTPVKRAPSTKSPTLLSKATVKAESDDEEAEEEQPKKKPATKEQTARMSAGPVFPNLKASVEGTKRKRGESGGEEDAQGETRDEMPPPKRTFVAEESEGEDRAML